jgi:hypothetical protein
MPLRRHGMMHPVVRRHLGGFVVLALVTAVATERALAQGADEPPPPEAPVSSDDDALDDAAASPADDAGPEADEPSPSGPDLGALAAENAALRDELRYLEEDFEQLHAQVDGLMRIRGRLSGYVDFGFFAVGGDGTGFRPDYGNVHFPEYADRFPGGAWVFMGDPLSTAINARGEPAATGDSRAVTFDPIGNRGKPSFILNAINVSLFAALTDRATMNAMIDVVPRNRDVSDAGGVFLGDFVDAKLGYLEYLAASRAVELSIFAGKFDSVLGVEYRSQESVDRMGVTPSLICRYTCGRPLGLKARAGFWQQAFIVNAAVTNGSHFQEMFPFVDEIDRNSGKTLSGRVSYRFPVGTGIEVGASGAIGPQDGQPRNSVMQWHYGFDLHGTWNDVRLAAEFVQGRAPGESVAGRPPCEEAACIEYKGAYGLLAYRATNWLAPYVRVDWRDALHEHGGSFVYISELVRFTGGARFDLGRNVIIKAEYVVNRELGRAPQFPNDVFTSSLVMRY